MDCVSGRLLIYRLNDASTITKGIILNWFQQIIDELEKYHKCKNQCYRYLNPYTVLVTEEEKISLLDLHAQSNSFVIKNMQKPALREHFVKPVIHIKESSKLSVDFYCLGKTIQFVLACSEEKVCFTYYEIYLLSKIIDKCLNKSANKFYTALKQVQKELPKIHTPKAKVKKRK